jgi:Arc/MetJ family transcription regulator
VIFKRVGDGRPYPDHGLEPRDWAAVPPRQVRLDSLVTTKDTLRLAALLDEDSTCYGDLFAHVVAWHGDLPAGSSERRIFRRNAGCRRVQYSRPAHLMAIRPAARMSSACAISAIPTSRRWRGW